MVPPPLGLLTLISFWAIRPASTYLSKISSPTPFGRSNPLLKFGIETTVQGRVSRAAPALSVGPATGYLVQNDGLELVAERVDCEGLQSRRELSVRQFVLNELPLTDFWASAHGQLHAGHLNDPLIIGLHDVGGPRRVHQRAASPACVLIGASALVGMVADQHRHVGVFCDGQCGFRNPLTIIVAILVQAPVELDQRIENEEADIFTCQLRPEFLRPGVLYDGADAVLSRCAKRAGPCSDANKTNGLPAPQAICPWRDAPPIGASSAR